MQPAGPNRPDNAAPADIAEVHRLLHCLQSLLEGQSTIDELVACGPPAIPPLADFLLAGRIVSVPQPRVWAVEALARLGARHVLVEYLEAPPRTTDPQLLFAEDAVRNAAARWLGRWHDEQTFEILLRLCRKRNLPGAIESLAEFQRVEAIPCFDRALEDDLCRPAAEDGLRKLGAKAATALMLSAVTPLPDAADETPSSLIRRRTVLALLVEIGVDTLAWNEFRSLLTEGDAEIVVRIAQLAAAVTGSEDRARAASALVQVLPAVPWHAAKDAEEALLALAPESVPPVAAERQRRSAKPATVRAGDEVLRLLLRLEVKLRRSS